MVIGNTLVKNAVLVDVNTVEEPVRNVKKDIVNTVDKNVNVEIVGLDFVSIIEPNIDVKSAEPDIVNIVS
jgi:hypothetical protein